MGGGDGASRPCEQRQESAHLEKEGLGRWKELAPDNACV